MKADFEECMRFNEKFQPAWMAFINSDCQSIEGFVNDLKPAYDALSERAKDGLKEVFRGLTIRTATEELKDFVNRMREAIERLTGDPSVVTVIGPPPIEESTTVQ